MFFNKKEAFSLFFTINQRNIDKSVPKAHYRKRLVVKQRRYERVYKPIADLNVTFCEKGAATEHIKMTTL